MGSNGSATSVPGRDRTRQRIVSAAAALLAEGGRDAVSTRAVSVAAGVQAPTLYRLFGNKQGLLEAVAAHGLTTYLNSKTDRKPSADPVDDLRAGWDLHVGFGLANPALYSLMYGEPRPDAPPPAAAAAAAVLALTFAALPRRADCASGRTTPHTSFTRRAAERRSR